MGVLIATLGACSPAIAQIPREDLRLWLKSDAGITKAGEHVASWEDQSGTGSTAVQADPANQPFLRPGIINGRDAVSFSGSQFMTSRLPVNGLDQMTVVLVGADVNSGSAAAIVWGGKQSGGGIRLGSSGQVASFGFGGESVNSPAPATERFSVLVAVKNGSQEALFVNGKASLALGNRISRIANTDENLVIGGSPAAREFFSGDIAEVLVYGRALGDAERQELETYLLERYAGPQRGEDSARPEVDAGPDQMVTSQFTTDLSGTAPSGSHLNLEWTKVSGPGQVTFSAKNEAATAAAFSAPGSYVLRFTASSGQQSASDDVTVVAGADAAWEQIPARDLHTWLRPGAGVTVSGDGVSGWADQSGNGFNAIQDIAGNRPMLVGGDDSRAVRLDGIDDFMTLKAPPSGTTGLSIIVAASGRDACPAQEAGQPGTSSPLVRMAPLAQTANQSTTSGSSAQGTVCVSAYVKNAAAETLFVDGTEVSTGSEANVFLDSEEGRAYLGRVAEGLYSSADVYEVLVYSRALSDSERQQVEAYLAGKYAGASTSKKSGRDNPLAATCAGPATGAFSACYYKDKTMTNPVLSRTDAYPLNFTWGAGSPGAAVPVNVFSARWQGNFVFEAGSYTFTVTSDDGIRVYLDGARIVDRWAYQGATPYTVTRSVAAGTHAVKVEYYDNFGDALAKFSWTKVPGTGTTTAPAPAPAPSPAPAPAPVTATCPAPGSGTFTGCYYDNKDLTGLKLSRTDATIHFDWGTGSPDSQIAADTFSARWEGDFAFESGTYTFSISQDDGMRLFIDGALVYDRWADCVATGTATRTMTAGTHRVKVEYYENGGGAVAKVAWVKSGTTTVAPDATAPSVPTGLNVTAISGFETQMSWTAATDNVAVTGYRVYRGTTQVGTTAGLSYRDTGLTAGTAYTYTVAAYDAAGNLSAPSAAVTVTTPIATSAVVADIRTYGARCDGVTNDTAAVNAAIASLPSTGGTVLVSCVATIGAPGVYIGGKNNVTVMASAPGNGFRAHSASGTWTDSAHRPMLKIRGCNGCAVRNMLFDGRNLSVGFVRVEAGQNNVIESNTTRNVGWTITGVIMGMGNRNNRYINNRIEGTASDPNSNEGMAGLWIGNPGGDLEYDPLIENNTVLNGKRTCIVGGQLDGGIIRGNHMENCSPGAGIKFGSILGAKVVVVENNRSINNHYAGIVIAGTGAVVIRNNHIEGSRLTGMGVDTAATGEITGNVFVNNHRTGEQGWLGQMYVRGGRDLIIQNNQFYDTNPVGSPRSDHGISVDTAEIMSNVRILNNLFKNHSGNGVYLQNRTGGSISSMTLSGNAFVGNTESGLKIAQATTNGITSVSLGSSCFAANGINVKDNRPSPLPQQPSSGACADPSGK